MHGDLRTDLVRRRDVLQRQLAVYARNDPAVFASFVMRDEETGQPIKLAPMHVEWQDLFSKYRRLVLWSATEHGKAVPLSTEIPTPRGWRTMGDLQVGDKVFARDGSVCRVTAATGVQWDRCVYEVTFDDGAKALADADHRWIVWDQRDRDRASKGAGAGAATLVVRTTQEMFDAGLGWREGHRWKLPVAGAVQYATADLPIHPYVLGAWLGDGTSSAGALTFHQRDREIFERCLNLEGSAAGKVRHHHKATEVVSQTILDLRGRLGALGVLGDKHIPASYMTGSIEQRQELLAGLLDTDGHVSRGRGGGSQVEFCTTLPWLANQVAELVRSLGMKASIVTGRATLNGRDVGAKYRVMFTARAPVFRLARKVAAQQVGGGADRARYRAIVAVRQVASVPVKCITVDSVDSSYLMGRDYTVTHNSSQVIARLLWEIGRNPKVRIVLLSATEGQAKKLLGVIARYIMKSEEYRLVFPHVVPSKLQGEGWTETAITVARTGYLKDPTVQALGYEGALMGARTDIMVLDDVLNWENTRTHEQRKKLIDWVAATVKGRLTRAASFWLVGTAYHREDLMHRLAKGKLFHWARYPGIDEEGRIAWDRYDRAYFLAKADDLGPVEYARQVLCKAITDEESRFKQAWIDRMLALGNQRSPAYAFDTRKLEGVKIYTGVDLAVQRTDKSDRSAFFTVAVDPYHQNRKRVLWLESGRISGPEILDRLYDHDRRYHPVQVVENNACFPPSALVTTQRGQVPIGLVVEGDMVLTHLGRWRRVIERTCREYHGPLCRVEVAGGPRLTCTPNHALWARAGALGAEGWTSVRELRTSEDHHVLRPTEGGRDQWCRVGEVQNVVGYDSFVYNLVVEEDHSYVVEGVAAHNSQDYILQFAAKDARGPLPLIPYTTGATKAHPEFGIESLAVEMNQGAWELPNMEGEFGDTQVGIEFAELIQEMLAYNPRAHTGDRLMAMFFAREGIIRGFVRGESGPLDVTSR